MKLIINWICNSIDCHIKLRSIERGGKVASSPRNTEPLHLHFATMSNTLKREQIEVIA